MLEREASPAMAASPDPSVRPPSADAVPAEGEEGGQVKLLLPFPVDFSMPVGSILRVLPFNHARPLLEDPCEAPHWWEILSSILFLPRTNLIFV
jgi:hypothetical protein